MLVSVIFSPCYKPQMLISYCFRTSKLRSSLELDPFNSRMYNHIGCNPAFVSFELFGNESHNLLHAVMILSEHLVHQVNLFIL